MPFCSRTRGIPGLGFLQTSGSNEWQCSSIFKGSNEGYLNAKRHFLPSWDCLIKRRSTSNMSRLGDHKPPMCNKSRINPFLNNRTKIQKINHAIQTILHMQSVLCSVQFKIIQLPMTLQCFRTIHTKGIKNLHQNNQYWIWNRYGLPC